MDTFLSDLELNSRVAAFYDWSCWQAPHAFLKSYLYTLPGRVAIWAEC